MPEPASDHPDFAQAQSHKFAHPITVIRRAVIAVASLVLLLPHGLSADTHYVSKTGSNTFPYTSWATATDSVKLAIETADAWDSVRVGPGLYIEDSIETKTGMALSGVGHDSTTLEIAVLDGIFTQFVLMGDSTVIEGFTLLGKSGDRGVSFRFGNAGIVRHNRIVDFHKGIHASLIYFKDPNATVEIVGNTIELAAEPIEVSNGFAVIRDNRIYPPLFGRAIECARALPIVEHNTIGGLPPGLTRERRQQLYSSSPDLLSLESITIEFCSDFIVRNNIIWGGSTGIWINNESIPSPTLPWGVVENNTVYDVLRHGIGASRNNVLVRNNIVAKAGQLASALVATLDSVRFEYNLIWDYSVSPEWDTALVRDNLFLDPMFEDTIDFRLQAFSPAIDGGDPALLDVDGTRSDIGAHGGPFGEMYPYLDLPPKTPAGFSGARSDTQITVSWVANTESDLSHYEIYRDSTAILQADPTLLLAAVPSTEAAFVDTSVATNAQYYYRMHALDNQDNASVLTDELVLAATGINDDGSGIVPYSFRLYPNYPNPFNSRTTVRFSVGGEAGSATPLALSIHNLLGQRTRTLLNRHGQAGDHRVVWDGKDDSGKDVASGIYFIVLECENTRFVRKAMLLK